MHSTMQQTIFFTNHGLHPRFDIQDVNNVVNPRAEDQTMWLANIWAQLVSNRKEVQRWYEENVDKYRSDEPNFKVKGQVWFQRQNIETTRPSKKLNYQKFGLFTIMKQINTMAFQFKFPNSMKIHLVFDVSLLEPYHASTILRRTHEPPPLIAVNGE
jgi:hypothetical protein